VYRSPMPLRHGTPGGLRKRERQIASAVAVVFVVVVLTDASPLHPRRWSTSCQARGGDVAPAAAARSSITTHGCRTNDQSGDEMTLSCIT
jgi:hypothetical protein